MMMMALAMALALAQEKGPAAGKPPSPAPSGYVEPQDPDRPAIPASDLKALRDTNVYSPKKTIRPPGPRGLRNTELPPKPKPKPLMVTGIIFDTTAKCYQVIIEDRNTEKMRLISEPKFLKAGDTLLVYTIESVETEKVVVRYGESKKELKVGDPMPDAGIKAPEGASDASSDESADGPPDPEADAAKADAKTDAKTDSKSRTKVDSKSSESAQPLDEAARRKILEERMKKLGKKRKTDEEN